MVAELKSLVNVELAIKIEVAGCTPQKQPTPVRLRCISSAFNKIRKVASNSKNVFMIPSYISISCYNLSFLFQKV